MKVVAVNGRSYSADELRDALKAAKAAGVKVELLVENTGVLRTYPLDYHGGLRYPHLECIDGVPDLLSEIVKPLTGR